MGTAVAMGLALAAAPSVAADAQRDSATITHPPTLSGKAMSGETMSAVGATWTANRPPTVTYRWIRCTGSTMGSCSLISGATSTSYKVTDADVGRTLLVWLTVRSGDAQANALSERSAVVAAKPKPTPTPTPTPTVTPTPTPKPKPTPTPTSTPTPTTTPTPTPTTTATPTPEAIVPPDVTTPVTPTGDVAGEHATALRWLSPFPVVRIKGWLTASGARVTMLTVRAPRGSHVTVRCIGRHCPRKRFARATALVHLKPYQRLLRGAMRLEISVTRRGWVGKRTVITLRKGKAPTRRDLCLYPGSSRAKACVTS